MRRFLVLPLVLLLSACASDKYPYPAQFVTAEEACPCELGAPPAKGSKEYKKEISGIIAAQAKLTEAQKAQIMAEDHISPAMIVMPVLGEHYSEANYPALYSLLKHAASDAWRYGDSAQDFWGRTRPWLSDSRVKILVSTIKRPSYPSGHSTTNHVWANILAELFPAKREAFFARAYEIGMHRTQAGVHYPSDVNAGKKFAATLFKAMQGNAQFQSELNAAREEVKGSPKAIANDNAPLAHAKAANCNTPEPGMSMTMCH